MRVPLYGIKIISVFPGVLLLRFIILSRDLVLQSTPPATSVDHISDNGSDNYCSSNAATNDATKMICVRTCTRARPARGEQSRPFFAAEVVDNHRTQGVITVRSFYEQRRIREKYVSIREHY